METARIFEKSEVKRSFFEIVNNTACSALNYDSRLFLSDFFFVVYLAILFLHRQFIIDNLNSTGVLISP